MSDTANQGTRFQRQPDRVGQIRANFHEDGAVCCPRDGEIESVAQHAKAGGNREDHWERKCRDRRLVTLAVEEASTSLM